MDTRDATTLPMPSPSLDALEHQITELSAHIHAATYRLLCLIAEFDRRKGWSQWGIRSCAHWLNWKCGIGLVAARNKVRVARSLEHLPQISEAFRLGQVSYSKVRAMTRVATPENEDYLLQIARHGTAAHVERLVCNYRKVQAIAERQRANSVHEQRRVNFYHDSDGALIIEARLATETGEIVLKALAAAGEALYQRRRKSENDSAEPSLQEGLYGPPGPAEGIAEDAETPWWQRATHETQSYAARRADALVLMAESLLTNGAASRTAGERNQIVVHVDAEVLADPGAAGRSELEDGPSLAAESARRLACDAGVVRLVADGDGLPLDVGRKTRSIPPSIQRALRARDRGCRFPGCTARHFVEGHHVKHWARGGETSLANLVQLCHFHHRLVHEGGYGVRVTGTRRFQFTRPDGRIIEPVPENDSAESSRDTDIESVNRAHGLDIDARTCVSLWDGTAMDLATAVDALLTRGGALHLDHETGHYPAHFPPSTDQSEHRDT
ncbi:MAG: DUF222 domain-containing protein [Gammaproteobacteria bacterium]|nr:DUF222 domain-containing protein [Gammaproteobacteria bacterium]NIS04825.1 DUF222 domain-containing protein [Gammaproteobacteria bacterium]NIW55064.1 DUF222 domain-containing protein [Gammaproteobacteria bacterium]NIX04149.1 DUF222 domain-containing protein [Gammaproteobacteria bacterium]